MTDAPPLSPDGRYQWVDGQWQPVPWAPVAASSGSDSKAVISLVLAILWVGGLGSLVAVIMGHLSRSEARKAGREPNGLALAGLIIGYLGLVLLPVLIAAVAVPVFLVQASRSYDADARSALRDAAVAEETYYVENNSYSSDLPALPGYRTPSDVTVTVLSTDIGSYCLSAKAHGGGHTYYFQSQTGLSTVPCS